MTEELLDSGSEIDSLEDELPVLHPPTMGLAELTETEISAIDKIFRNPWWERVWVIQEATVARELCVICGTVGSPANFNEARSWLEQCVRHHSSCAASIHYSMPLRVIEICCASGRPQPTLHLVRPIENAKYAALTYCWGDPRSMELSKLTRKTHEA